MATVGFCGPRTFCPGVRAARAGPIPLPPKWFVLLQTGVDNGDEGENEEGMEGCLKVDTLGIEPRASCMLSGCDTTTPCALEREGIVFAPNDKWPLQPTGVPRRLGKRKGQKTRIRGGGSWAESLRSHLAHQPTSQPAPRSSAPPLAPHPRQSGAGSVPA